MEPCLLELWRNLGGTFCGTVGGPRRICPTEPEAARNLRNLGGTLLAGTLAEPWSNLLRNLLAVQDGSAPENQRESESNSTPKPLLWPKTPKLLLLGKCYQTFNLHMLPVHDYIKFVLGAAQKRRALLNSGAQRDSGPRILHKSLGSVHSFTDL